ncbi:protein translocase subunit SecD [bacterium]|nr:protein translocase subunit SecD [bacterium]|tara:strand:- start:181 stop:1488 length:1308 start_codon:yes stop_codon:yes gene_type:complete
MSNFKLIFSGLLISLGIFIIFKKDINLGLDLQGGMHLVLQTKPTNNQPLTRESVLGSIEVIRNRIDSLGLTEPSIRIKGKDQISIELPGIKNPDEAKAMIGDTALLEFFIAEWAPPGIETLAPEKQKILIGESGKLAFMEQDNQSSSSIKRPIILKEIALTGADLKQASPGTDQFGKPIVNLEFTPEGGNKFYKATAKSINKPLAILLDKRIISAPNVNQAISGGKAQISGDFTPNEVSNLIIKLNAGALPIPVEIISEKQIGPTLGKDSIEKSKKAFLVGLLLVGLYMIFIYKGPGILASISLVSYIILSFSLFKLIDATLTLPGIAGFILTMGMAVDANVIIFERIKEECNNNTSLKANILNGFKHAYITILDANITTLIAAVVLFWLGTGTIKGFAITLSIGILISMFSAITITQGLLLSFQRLSNFNKGKS